MTVQLRQLGPDDLDAVVQTFQRAFADYVVDLKLSRDDLLNMMARRGADLTASAGAFEGDEMVAVMAVAVEDFEGIPSAYDVFTGVVPEARGQALARRLFDTATPSLNARGVERFVLEVIEKNEAAVHSYRRVGFTERRQLRVFAFDAVETPDLRVVELDLEEAFDRRPGRLAAPSWQNSDASIRRVAADVVALGVRERDEVVGVAFCAPRNRDVPQVHVRAGREDVLRALIAAARARNQSPGPLRVVNVDAGATWLARQLAAFATEEYPPQFEMVKSL